MTKGLRYLKHPVTDFRAAFTNGQRFQDDDCEYEMSIEQIAELCLPTGKIVAADPRWLDDCAEMHFRQLVPPGKYPVDVAVCHRRNGRKSGERRTACMRVRFADAPVADWIIATTPEHDPDSLRPFQIHGYGVDVGMGSFADSSGLVAVLQKYTRDGKTLYDNFYFEQVLPAFEASGYRFADIPLDPLTGANLVICESGMGDGVYASYWGFDEHGTVASLVTDFRLLTRGGYKTRELGLLTDLVGRERGLKLPGGFARLRSERPNKRTIVITKSGTATGNWELELRRNGKTIDGKYGTHMSAGPTRITETKFWKSIPDDVVAVVTYLDYFEPMPLAEPAHEP